jgi:predicted anti-sigma-YlaC factor YlaD
MNVIPVVCERARLWSSLRVDGELSELESALLDSHLGRCDDCRTFARRVEGAAAALAAAPVETPDVQAHVASRPRRVSGSLRSAAITSVVAVIAAVAVAAGISAPGAVHATKPVAMVHALDTPNELRTLRRPGLIVRSQAQVPRNRLVPDESY